MSTKACSECKVVKDYNEFHVNNQRKSGRSSKCKECVCKKDGLPRSTVDTVNKMKSCTKCKKMKEYSEFYKCKKNKTTGLKPQCKDCERPKSTLPRKAVILDSIAK